MRPMFFIPSFNDQLGLPQMVQALLGAFPQARVLVVDDGSSPPIALAPADQDCSDRAKLLRLEFNSGLGLVSSVAMDYFMQSDCDVLLRLDADGQHPIAEIEGLLGPLSEGAADVVLGERSNHMAMYSPRQLMSSVTKQSTAWVGQKIFRSPVMDWYTGFFAINREAAAVAARAHLERYCEVQLLCLFHCSKLRIVTHSIEQLERVHGKSTIGWSAGVMIFLRSTLTMVLYALRMHPR